jgi:hypothetical protein
MNQCLWHAELLCDRLAQWRRVRFGVGVAARQLALRSGDRLAQRWQRILAEQELDALERSAAFLQA